MGAPVCRNVRGLGRCAGASFRVMSEMQGGESVVFIS